MFGVGSFCRLRTSDDLEFYISFCLDTSYLFVWGLFLLEIMESDCVLLIYVEYDVWRRSRSGCGSSLQTDSLIEIVLSVWVFGECHADHF